MAADVTVEIVGLPGSGKTTLLGGLRCHGQAIQPSAILRGPRYAHVYALHALRLLPLFVRRTLSTRRLSWQEMRWMVRVRAWLRILGRRRADRPSLMILDQGPVYTLTRLAERGIRESSDPASRNWWNQMVEQWVPLLDALVWLDAPDHILMQRVRGRAKWHSLKGGSHVEAAELLARSRQVYSQVIQTFRGAGGGSPVVLPYDTSNQTAERTLEDCLVALDEVRRRAARRPPREAG